MEARANEIGKD